MVDPQSSVCCLCLLNLTVKPLEIQLKCLPEFRKGGESLSTVHGRFPGSESSQRSAEGGQRTAVSWGAARAAPCSCLCPTIPLSFGEAVSQDPPSPSVQRGSFEPALALRISRAERLWVHSSLSPKRCSRPR